MLVIGLPVGAVDIRFPFSKNWSRYDKTALPLLPGGNEYPMIEAGTRRSAADVNIAGSDGTHYGCYKYQKVDYTLTGSLISVLQDTIYLDGRITVRVRVSGVDGASVRAVVNSVNGTTMTTSGTGWQEINLGDFDASQGDVVLVQVSGTGTLVFDYYWAHPIEPIEVQYDKTEYRTGNIDVFDGSYNVFAASHVFDGALKGTNGLVDVINDGSNNIQLDIIIEAGGTTKTVLIDNNQSTKNPFDVRFISQDMLELGQQFFVGSYHYDNLVRLFRNKPFLEFDPINTTVRFVVEKSDFTHTYLPETTGVNKNTIVVGAISLTNLVDDYFAVVYDSGGDQYAVYFVGAFSAISVVDLTTQWRFDVTLSSASRYWIGGLVNRTANALNATFEGTSFRNLQYHSREATSRWLPRSKISLVL